jgi:hypothetical protein
VRRNSSQQLALWALTVLIVAGCQGVPVASIRGVDLFIEGFVLGFGAWRVTTARGHEGIRRVCAGVSLATLGVLLYRATLIADARESVGESALPAAGFVAVMVLFSLAKKYIKPWQPPPPGLDRQKALESIGVERRRELMDSMDATFRASGKFLLSYWPEEEGRADPYARIGGNPLALPDERWPTATAPHMRPLFLLQLVLRAPRLPAQWQGRLLSVFLQDEGVLYICSYAPEVLDQLVPLVRPVSEYEVSVAPLRELALPDLVVTGCDEGELALSCDKLMELHPQVRKEMAPFSDPHDRSRMLNALLAGRTDWPWYWFPSDAILVGGAPAHIQIGSATPECRRCREPMRFLLQFPDLAEQFSDCGIAYVYGCDAHPECCAGLIEST